MTEFLLSRWGQQGGLKKGYFIVPYHPLALPPSLPLLYLANAGGRADLRRAHINDARNGASDLCGLGFPLLKRLHVCK